MGAQAATLLVGPSAGACIGTYASPQAAVAAAASGDTVSLCPGTYGGPIDVGGKALTLQSTTGKAADAIVDASQSVGIAANASLTVKGLTLRGGIGISIAGGTATLTNVAAAGTGGHGIVVTGGAGAHTLTNVSATGTGYGNAGISIAGGKSATLIDVDAYHTSGTGGYSALGLTGIPAVTIGVRQKASATFRASGGGNYTSGLHSCPPAGATGSLTISDAVIATNAAANALDLPASKCGSTTLKLTNVTATVGANYSTGIFVAAGAGDHTLTNVSAMGSGYGSYGIYIGGGRSATLTDVDAEHINGKGFGALGLTDIDAVTIGVGKKPTATFKATGGGSHTTGISYCPASGTTGTLTVSNATIATDATDVRTHALDAAQPGCGKVRATLANVTVRSSGHGSGISIKGAGDQGLGTVPVPPAAPAKSKWR